MAVPKGKVSKARRDKRRSAVWKLKAPGLVPMREIILSLVSSGFLLWASMGEMINWWTSAACRLGWPRVASRQISALPRVQKPSP